MDKLAEERDGGFFYVEWVGEPCPWCGCAGVSGKSPEGHFFAGCPDADCLAHNLAYDFVTVDHARSAWDARAAIAQKRVNELEAERDALQQALADTHNHRAELEAALREAREALALGAEIPPVDHKNRDAVINLGERIGYGALMATASVEWRGMLGDLEGSEFCAGPCRSTAEKAIAAIDAALPTMLKGNGDGN